MLQTILILLVPWAVGAIKEVEIMFNLPRSGRIRGNKRRERIKTSFRMNESAGDDVKVCRRF